MKRLSWPVAGPLALAIVTASGLTCAFFYEDLIAADDCVNSQNRSVKVCVGQSSSGTRGTGEAPDTIVIYLTSTDVPQKNPYFYVDKRHRPALWRSAKPGRRGDKKRSSAS